MKKYTWMHTDDIGVGVYNTEQEAVDAYVDWAEDNYELDGEAFICEIVPTKRISVVKEVKLESI